ncbi:hypothetical protein H4R26_006175, partial [Coemansia thaxteri]
SQQFTQHDTVLMSPSSGSVAARAARPAAAANDPASGSTLAAATAARNTFNPRMHASIMFSKSDRVLISNEQADDYVPSAPAGLANARRSHFAGGRSAFEDGYLQHASLSRAFLTQESIYDSYQDGRIDGLAGASQFTVDGASQFTQDYSSQHFTQY